MAKLSFDLEAAKAAFAARGGEVTRVDAGARAIESDRAIYAAMRNGGRVAADSIAADRSAEAQAERQAEAFRAAKYDGWRDADALAYSQSAR
jgi:hypothetical protein